MWFHKVLGSGCCPSDPPPLLHSLFIPSQSLSIEVLKGASVALCDNVVVSKNCQSATAALNSHNVKNLWLISFSFAWRANSLGLQCSQCPLHHWKHKHR